MHTAKRFLPLAFWTLVVALFAFTTSMLVWYTPIEATMGTVQKIFYLHLPVALNTFVAAMVVFIASVGYLWSRSMWWDDLAAAAAKITALFCSVVLLTGMIWAKSAWGLWWTWSPRLTFSLVLFLLYIVYVMLRPSIESPERRALISSIYGIAAFLDVPLVYLSVRLLPDIHPSSITLDPKMQLTLLAWALPVTLLNAGLLTATYRLHRLQRIGRRRSTAAVAPLSQPVNPAEGVSG